MACHRHPKRRKTGALPLSLPWCGKGSPLARRTSLYFSREMGGKDTASEGSRRMSAPIRRAKPVQNRVLRARPAEFHSACVPMHPPLPYARRALTALYFAEYARAAEGCGNSPSPAKNGATITGGAIGNQLIAKFNLIATHSLFILDVHLWLQVPGFDKC